MRPVSTTLTLLILVFPILLISTLFAVVVYLYHTSLDASSLLSAMSTFLSAILVDLLVWERLRGSLSKKLEYLHKNILFKLYSGFRNSEGIFFREDQMKKLRPDLERYGKFMGISLYPRNLPEQIDEFLIYDTEFYGSLRNLDKLVEKYGLSPERELLYHFIGTKPLGGLGSFNPALVKAYRKRMPTILKDQSQLIEEIKGLLEKTERMRKQIFEKLEDFLKSNNLRLEPEPVHYLRL